jgi:hypothetical protein
MPAASASNIAAEAYSGPCVAEPEVPHAMQGEMPQDEPGGPGAAASGDVAEGVADTAVATWRLVDAALSPIIGVRGVAALYQRSLHLARLDHPGLRSLPEGALEPVDLDALHEALSRLPAAQAATANEGLLQTFRDLLATLIGARLTGQLLATVPVAPSGGKGPQENAP